MKTEKTNVDGKCYIWAIPKSDWEIERDVEEFGKENVVPFKYIITASSSHYSTGAVRVHEFSVVGTVPPGVDLIKAAVTTMRDEIIAIRKTADDEIAVLEEKIKHLALIEYQPNVAETE